MSGADRLRSRLLAHLERLRDEGVWGLEIHDARGAEPSGAAPACRATPRPRIAPPRPTAPPPRPAPPPRRAPGLDAAPPPTPGVEAAPAPGVVGAHPPARPSRAAAAGPANESDGTFVEEEARQVDLFGVDAAGERQHGETLEEVEKEALVCVACRLHEGRTKVVFGVGATNARLMFIGEGPGRDEDLQGEPFVGRAGRLLDRIIEAMGMRREDVYIANAVKCRPPDNRNPHADEMEACSHFLMRQIALVQPKLIVLLGRVAVQAVLGSTAPLSRLRGRFQEWRRIRVMCTYHPAYLLRNPNAKRLVWEDMQRVRDALGIDREPS